jgi:hypothetical protein
MTSMASGVCATAAASSAADSRRSCLREACTRRRALRACAPPLEFTSSPSSRLVSGQRWTAYSSCTSRVMSATVPDPLVGLVAAADALLGERLQEHLHALAALLARPRADDVDGRLERLGVAGRGDLLQGPQPQGRDLAALERAEQEPALELAGAVEVEHGPRPPPAARRHARARERRPHVLLAPVEVLDRDPPQLPLEDLVAGLLLRGDGHDAALHADPATAPAAHGAHDDRAAAVDVAVQQGVQRDDRVVVAGLGRDEVDDDARLLARMPAGDATDALLVDAPRGGRREVHADRRARRVPALASSWALTSTSTSPRS